MDALRKISFLQLALFSFFGGFMMATAVRSVVPAITLVTAPLMCPGKAVVAASWYKCKTGHPTIAQQPFDLPNIFVVMALTAAFYTIVFFIIAAIAKAVAGKGEAPVSPNT